MKPISVCHCRQCQAARRKGKSGWMVRHAWHKFRRQQKAWLRRGEEPPVRGKGVYFA